MKPLKSELKVPNLRTVADFQQRAMKTLNDSSPAVSSYEGIIAAGGVGLGVGSTVAIGSWVAMSALGAASTGTAIAGLHGIAATNAILAPFGEVPWLQGERECLAVN